MIEPLLLARILFSNKMFDLVLLSIQKLVLVGVVVYQHTTKLSYNIVGKAPSEIVF